MPAEETDSLLAEQQAPWEAASDIESVETHLNLKNLFQDHAVIRKLQESGVIKLGEFSEKSSIVYSYFNGAPIKTMGSQNRNIDVESIWRHKMRSATKAKHTGWSTDVVVEAFIVTIPDAADPDKDGLLQPLLKRYQAGACTLQAFGLPIVQATIDFKWHAFARRLLLWELFSFMIWLVSFYGFTWLFQDEDLSLSLGQLLSTSSGRLTVLLEFSALLGMFPFLVLEQGTLAAYGLKGWADIWNGLDIITYGLQLSITFMHLCRISLTSDTLSAMLALQCILLLFRSQYYSRVFKSTRFAFLEAVRDVVSEIKFYFVFLIVIVFGFAAAFHVLFRLDQVKMEHFETFGRSFITVYGAMEDGLDYDELLEHSRVPIAACILNVVFAFVMGLVLVNLLIGIMSNALEKVTQNEGLKLLLHKAQIIDELESTMPRWLENKFTGEWYPRYIHILRIDPDREDKVDLEGTWSRSNEHDGGESNTSSNDEESSRQLKRQLMTMQKQLDVIQSQLSVLTASSGGAATSSMIRGAGSASTITKRNT